MDDSNCGFCANVDKWFQQPFSSNGSFIDWFFFVGLIFIAIFFWTRILARIA